MREEWLAELEAVGSRDSDAEGLVFATSIFVHYGLLALVTVLINPLRAIQMAAVIAIQINISIWALAPIVGFVGITDLIWDTWQLRKRDGKRAWTTNFVPIEAGESDWKTWALIAVIPLAYLGMFTFAFWHQRWLGAGLVGAHGALLLAGMSSSAMAERLNRWPQKRAELLRGWRSVGGAHINDGLNRSARHSFGVYHDHDNCPSGQ